MSARLWVRFFLVLITSLVLLVIFLLYRDHQRYTLESALVPIVKPDTAETKVRPQDPEGMDIPNTELSVYEHLDDKKTKLPKPVVPANPIIPPLPAEEDSDAETPAGGAPSEAKPAEDSAPDIRFMPASSLKGSMIDLGLFSSQEEAGQTWSRAKANFPPTFQGARPSLVREQGMYHLYVVDIPDTQQAGDVCMILTKIGLFCQVTGP
jgi:hypothetical protein